MKRLFFRYFISIFSIAVMVLLILFGVLFFQYSVSQNRWKVRMLCPRASMKASV